MMASRATARSSCPVFTKTRRLVLFLVGQVDGLGEGGDLADDVGDGLFVVGDLGRVGERFGGGGLQVVNCVCGLLIASRVSRLSRSRSQAMFRS